MAKEMRGQVYFIQADLGQRTMFQPEVFQAGRDSRANVLFEIDADVIVLALEEFCFFCHRLSVYQTKSNLLHRGY